MAGIVKGLNNVEILAQKAAKDFMSQPKNINADYNTVLERYRKQYAKQLSGAIGFTPTGTTYDSNTDDDDQAQ